MAKICGIYKITSPSGKIYVGQSCHIVRRWRRYRTFKAIGQPILQRSFFKYGVENHKFEVIRECKREELNVLEQHYIDLLRPQNNIVKKVGMTMYGRAHSEETKRKMSDAHKGKKFSIESRRRMSLAKRGHTHSEETRKKLSIWQKGIRKLSEEHKTKIGNANRGKIGMRGRKLPIGHIDKIKAGKLARKLKLGYVNSPEARKNMAKAQQLRFSREKQKI